MNATFYLTIFNFIRERVRAGVYSQGLLVLIPLLLMACGEVYFPTGPEPTGRALITIIEPPIGATRTAAFGQPATTRVTTSQPYKSIQGSVWLPSGGWAGGGSLPAAAPGMYYWRDYGVAYVATESGIYKHDYLSANEYGIDLANGLFALFVNHTFEPESEPFEICTEGCEDDSSAPPPPPGVVYDETVLTPDPYVSEVIAPDLTEEDLHDMAEQSSKEFLDYTAEQYGGEVEEWLIENGYLAPQTDEEVDFVERMDRYIEVLDQFTETELEATLPILGMETKEDIIRFLHRLQQIYQDKPTDRQLTAGRSPDSLDGDKLRFVRGFDVEVYPNPATDRATIRVPREGAFPAHLFIYDSLGRLVHRNRLDEDVLRYEWDTAFDTGQPAPAGQYFIVVRANSLSVTRPVTVVR